VHVLDDHEHGPWPRNLVEERGEDLLARRACEQTCRERPADHAGDVVQRAQRAGCHELVARAPEHAGAFAAAAREIGDEGRLAHSGLGRHQRDPTGLPAGGQERIEQVERLGPLPQLHGAMVSEPVPVDDGFAPWATGVISRERGPRLTSCRYIPA
jgi:hypothetical protein